MKIYILFALFAFHLFGFAETTSAKTKSRTKKQTPFQWSQQSSQTESAPPPHNCRIVVKSLYKNKQESFKIYYLMVRNQKSCEKNSRFYKKIYNTKTLKKDVRVLWFG